MIKPGRQNPRITTLVRIIYIMLNKQAWKENSRGKAKLSLTLISTP